MSRPVPINNDASSPVQSHGPAIFLPHEAIGNVVTKTNTLILEHRGYLDALRLQRESTSTTITTTSEQSLITPAPSYEYVRRQLGILPECSAAVSSVNATLQAQLASVGSTCDVRISSLSAALINAESAFASVQLSAAVALSTASVSARAIISVSASAANASVTAAQVSASSSVSSAISSAQSSASLAIASAVLSAQNSASVAIGLAQSSASVSIASAQNALTSAQLSASSVVESASSLASSASSAASFAEASASSAIQSAQASVKAAQASASATRVAAMNTTILALAITFSIIGSALISILIYYLISRYRRRRRERKQSELKERIHRVRHESDESLGPSLSAFPMPVGRSKWMSNQTGSRNGGESRPETAQITGGTGGPLSGSATLMGGNSQMVSAPLRTPGNNMSNERRTWAPNSGRMQGRGGGLNRQDINFAFANGSGTGSSQAGRQTWAANVARATGPSPSMKSIITKKTTLTYDPDHPERPPKFTTWLEESFRAVSPLPDMQEGGESRMQAARRSIMNLRKSIGGDNSRMSLAQRRRSKSVGEISDIGTAF